MRKTKVRIVGDPDLTGKVHLVLKDHFEFDGDEKCFSRAVGRSRYGKSKGITVYITIKKQRGVKPLPVKPGVRFVADILHNPIYVGIGPYERIVEDDLWIKCAALSIEEFGAEAFLKDMLGLLRESLRGTVVGKAES